MGHYALSRRHLLMSFGAACLTSAVTPLPVLAAVKEGDTLVFLNYRDLRDLNPHLYGGEMFAQEMLFEGLITLGNDGSYHPAIAESWTVSPDGLVYSFKIRSGLTFTDGEVLDAYAIEKNFDALIDNKARHTWLEMMRLLVSAIAVQIEFVHTGNIGSKCLQFDVQPLVFENKPLLARKELQLAVAGTPPRGLTRAF